MKRIAVIAAPGCEEGETLTIADVFRRAELSCDLVGLGALDITGGHKTVFRCDAVLDDTLADTYDMVILPGGYGGVDAMVDSELLLGQVASMLEAGKWVAAICAAPLALDKAGLLEGRTFTCYPGQRAAIKAGTWVNEVVVVDGKLVTSQGPATAWAFSYKLVELMGGDAEAVRQRMVYRNAFDEPEVEGAEPAPLCEVPGPDGSAPKKVAVLMIDGFEESETIQIVDLLRRAHVEASTYRFQEDEFVLGMQNLLVKSDAVFGPEVLEADAVVVPGGRTAGAKLIAREDVLDALRSFDREGKLIGAMCSGTTVAHAAGVLEGKRVTGYTGYGVRLTGATFIEDEVAVWDANVVTSQGPATPYPFAFKLMEALGIDPKPFKNRLLYALVGGK